MKIKDIVAYIDGLEKGKSKVKLGDIREIVSIISDLMWIDGQAHYSLMENGMNRALKREQKAKAAAKRSSR